jgi:hypothetical protein
LTARFNPPNLFVYGWVNNGASLLGPTGPQGFTGSDGLQGPQGFTGSDGTQGSQGLTGADGPQGFQGFTGPTGTLGNINTANTGTLMIVNPTGSNNVFFASTAQILNSRNNNYMLSIGPDIRGNGQTGAAMIINCTGFNAGIFYDNSKADVSYAASVIDTNDQILGPGVTTSFLQWYWRGSGVRHFGNISSGGNFFTGQHSNFSDTINIDSINDLIGYIVVSAGTYLQQDIMKEKRDVVSYININDALPKIELSSSRNQINVFGVISNWDNTTQGYDQNGNIYLDYSESGFGNQNLNNRIRVNGAGEGGIWVCNINGDFKNGNLITTCEIPGIGMLQDDNVIRSYTVAKITCDCNFDLNSPVYRCEEFQFNEITYRKAFVGCCYKCS